MRWKLKLAREAAPERAAPIEAVQRAVRVKLVVVDTAEQRFFAEPGRCECSDDRRRAAAFQRRKAKAPAGKRCMSWR